MGVILRVGRKRAILQNARWKAADLKLEAELQVITDNWIHETGGPAAGDLDPDLSTARFVARQQKGVILGASRPRRTRVLDTYFRKRQLPLDFGPPLRLG
jgi:hypothetical protein